MYEISVKLTYDRAYDCEYAISTRSRIKDTTCTMKNCWKTEMGRHAMIETEPGHDKF